jgi:hypothetical protein
MNKTITAKQLEQMGFSPVMDGGKIRYWKRTSRYENFPTDEIATFIDDGMTWQEVFNQIWDTGRANGVQSVKNQVANIIA